MKPLAAKGEMSPPPGDMDRHSCGPPGGGKVVRERLQGVRVEGAQDGLGGHGAHDLELGHADPRVTGVVTQRAGPGGDLVARFAI